MRQKGPSVRTFADVRAAVGLRCLGQPLPARAQSRVGARVERYALRSALFLRAGRAWPGARGFGTFRGSSRRGGTQAAGRAPRPAAARSGPEGEQAASTEVSAVAGRGGPWRARLGRCAARETRFLPGGSVDGSLGLPRSPRRTRATPRRSAPGRPWGPEEGGGGPRGRQGRGRGQGGQRAAVRPGRARYLAPPVHTPPSPRCLRAWSPAFLAAEFCWGLSMLGTVDAGTCE